MDQRHRQEVERNAMPEIATTSSFENSLSASLTLQKAIFSFASDSLHSPITVCQQHPTTTAAAAAAAAAQRTTHSTAVEVDAVLSNELGF